VTDDLENLRFNRAVAQIYTLANAIGEKADGAVRREALEALVLLSAPMMPHLAEPAGRRWAMRAGGETPWPTHDPALLADSVTIAVQVNGKRRGEITVAKDADSKTSKPPRWRDGVSARWKARRPRK
jgi:leucyl-tRNA synthetase